MSDDLIMNSECPSMCMPCQVGLCNFPLAATASACAVMPRSSLTASIHFCMIICWAGSYLGLCWSSAMFAHHDFIYGHAIMSGLVKTCVETSVRCLGSIESPQGENLLWLKYGNACFLQQECQFQRATANPIWFCVNMILMSQMRPYPIHKSDNHVSTCLHFAKRQFQFQQEVDMTIWRITVVIPSAICMSIDHLRSSVTTFKKGAVHAT